MNRTDAYNRQQIKSILMATHSPQSGVVASRVNEIVGKEKGTGYFSVERVSARMLEALRAENPTQNLSSFKTFQSFNRFTPFKTLQANAGSKRSSRSNRWPIQEDTGASRFREFSKRSLVALLADIIG